MYTVFVYCAHSLIGDSVSESPQESRLVDSVGLPVEFLFDSVFHTYVMIGTITHELRRGKDRNFSNESVFSQNNLLTPSQG